MDFREFIESNTVGTHNDGPGGAYLDTLITQSGILSSPSSPIPLGGTDITVPTVNKTSQIRFIEFKKTPILIQLADGTRMYFTLDEFNRIPGGKPQVGKMMTVVFQRNPASQNETSSQIQSVTVH